RTDFPAAARDGAVRFTERTVPVLNPDISCHRANSQRPVKYHLRTIFTDSVNSS
ncbi:hypothetical protein M9458_013874, partial [Cirrhinus mrigala]